MDLMTQVQWEYDDTGYGGDMMTQYSENMMDMITQGTVRI